MKKMMMIAAAAAFVMAGFVATDAYAGAEAKCKACHHFDKLKKKTGPGLKGIVGRKAGSVEGFKYSKSLKKANADGLIWTEENLRIWIGQKTKKAAKQLTGIKKTKMSFRGLKGKKLDEVIEFLKTL